MWKTSIYAAPDKGKAEIVDGELILMAPTGGVPARAGGEIYVSLREYERRKRGAGYAFPDNVGFLVNLPNRSSLSPKLGAMIMAAIAAVATLVKLL